MPFRTRAAGQVLQATDMPSGHASGPAPHRIALIGAPEVVAAGVTTHQLSLVGALARAVSGSTGRGADVHLSALPSSRMQRIRRERVAPPAARSDAAVVVLGSGGLTARVAAFVVAVARWLPPGAPLVLASAGPLGADGPAVLQAVRATSGAPSTLVDLSADVDADASPRTVFERWGRRIAVALVERLGEQLHWRTPYDELDEPTRQLAVSRLGRLDGAWEEEFRRIVTLASAAYGTRYAALSVIDGQRTRFMTRRGFDMTESEREDTICATALKAHDGVIVGDARADARFGGCGAVRGGLATFYAGYRVMSPDDQPVAALCVFDPEPRPVLTQDIALLRDFALAAQRRVWQLDRVRSRSLLWS